MAEKIISPGVFTNEIDQTFLPAAVADIGAALIGPTVKGPAGIPTVVTSFSEFQAKFGDVTKNGVNGDSVQFLTSHAAEEYLKNSDTLTVVRILDGTFGAATASIETKNSSATTVVGVNKATGSITIPIAGIGERYKITQGSTTFTFVASADGSGDASDNSIRFFPGSATPATQVANLKTEIDAVSDLAFTTKVVSTKLEFTASSAGIASNGVTLVTASLNTPATFGTAPAKGSDTDGLTIGGGTQTSTGGPTINCFTLETLADGEIMNNFDSTAQTNNILLSGSKNNIRFEVSNVNDNKGTFTLLIRAGNDNIKRKQTLESFTGINLDPNSPNFITKVIGDQVQTVRTDENSNPYLQLTGSFPNKSKFVRVKSVDKLTTDYIDENGNIRLASLTNNLPKVGSGSLNGGFGGGENGVSGFDALGNRRGTAADATYNFYENISSAGSQGYVLSGGADGTDAYVQALNILKNQDEFDINLILLPGIIDSIHPTITAKAIDVCEDRGDCFAIVDPVVYGKNVADATTRAEARDSNFAAMYWPWIKVPDSQIAGTQRWVPPSVTIGGIYAFNDRVAHPWFAPAGLNRGGITTAIQAERKLTQSDRDTLYDSNVNPIATFPGQGVTVFGQKTLQKKSSALDRINVRRLLIRVKKFIASSSRFLVFEQNTAATRRRFLGIVNPFLETVQSQSGLSAFRVVMDETNNTPDTIDRNQLIGQLFLQPTRTAEFIVLDFTIQPTGASFPE